MQPLEAKEQEDTNAVGTEMFIATVGLKADDQSKDWIDDPGES